MLPTNSPVPGIHPAETMASLVIVAPGRLELQQLPIPRLLPGHALIRMSIVGLCGADAALFDGSSVYLKEGLKSYPFIFGHEWSGRVEAVADDVFSLKPGQRVAGHNFITCEMCPACRSGHRLRCQSRSEMGVLGSYPGAASQYALVPAKVLAAIPDSLTDLEAALLEPASTAMHAIVRTGVHENDRVAVIGTGTLGLIATQLAAATGATVETIGIESNGRQLALTLGASRAISPADASADSYSVVIEASGSGAGISQAPRILAFGGRLALVGVPHHPVNGFPVAALVIKNAEVQAVLSGIDQWDRLIGAVDRGRAVLSPLIDAVFPYTDAEQAFQRLQQPGRDRPKVLIDFRDEQILPGGDSEWTSPAAPVHTGSPVGRRQ